MSHTNKVDSLNIVIRPFEERDKRDIVELHSFLKWPISDEALNSWCKRNDYTSVFVAQCDQKTVGKVTLDTAYSPYAELVNLMIHPNYRGYGIAGKLIETCADIAEKRRYSILYLMTEPNNLRALRLYRDHQFLPTIISPKKDIWLFRFLNNSFVQRFLFLNPTSIFNISTQRILFEGVRFYEIRWKNNISNSELALYIRGQPGQPEKGTAPRIGALAYKEGKNALRIVVKEESKSIAIGRPASFKLKMINTGKESVHLKEIDFLKAKGISLKEDAYPFSGADLEPGQEILLKHKVWLSKNFKIPPLSFKTIIVSVAIEFSEVCIPLQVSAGFERIS